MASDGRSQFDRDAYRNRNVVERCFGRLKNTDVLPHVTINGEKLSVDGKAGLHPALLQEVMQLRDTA
jgi:hypothetical protein